MTIATSPQNYSAAIVSALALDSPLDAVASVKAVVIRELQDWDHGAQIQSTDYFNHTYVPDLVLRWPRSSNRERHVYLRFTEDVEYLTDGLTKIDKSQPLVLGLTPPTVDDDIQSLRTLDEVASGRGALVTDPQAIETFIAARVADPVIGLVSNAISQGGKGFLDIGRTEQVATVISRGFEGAKQLSAEDTGQAADIMHDVLDNQQAGRLTRFLQAIWVGSGGRTDLFPGRPELSGGLSDDALEFLVNFDEVDDTDFWRRLGRKVTVDQLSNLKINLPSPNLQRLIKANLDILWARACAVISDSQPALDQPEEQFIWVIQNGTLSLQGRDFTTYVAELADDVLRLRAPATRGIDVQTLRRRARGIKMDSLRLVDAKDSLSFDSDDVVQDERLSGLADQFSPRALVEQARAILSSGVHVTVDFQDGTAIGVTRSKPLLAELLMAAISVLHDLTPQDRESLNTMLVESRTDGDQLDLFESD